MSFILIPLCSLVVAAFIVSLVLSKKRILIIPLIVSSVILLAAAAYVIIDTGKNNGDYVSEINFANPVKQVLTEEGNSPQIMIPTYNETATDGLGRVLPGYEETGGPKKGKYVGLFYSIWTATGGSVTTNYDVSKILAENPDNPKYGSKKSFHWWAEPETGYHKADDVWQIKRDMYYLSNAGIDFIYLDFTNGFIYQNGFKVLLDTCLELRAQGVMTPYIVPWTIGNASYGEVKTPLEKLYEYFYSKPEYDDLWFRWKWKPLVMVKPASDGSMTALENDFYKDYFTYRVAWSTASYPNEEKHRWWWSDNYVVNYEYGYGWDEDKKVAECIGIGAAGFAKYGSGRSGKGSVKTALDRFRETDTMGEGIVLQNAFNEVMIKNPEVKVLLFSRWNEWAAQYLGHLDFGFVDQYNREFSRDLEPMKGGYTDNYYYLLCSLVRRFKGVMPAEKNKGYAEIDVNSSFSQWDSIKPVYYDYTGDTSHRNSTDVTGKIRYVNESGRNDITECKVAYNEKYIYFYAKTAGNLTPYTDKNWMLLFIDADNDKSTGWEGYDYLVNKAFADENTTVICKYQNNLWQEAGIASFRYEGNQLQIEIPRALLGLTKKKVRLNFHWHDNVTDIYDLYSMFTTGDRAPERRNDYIVSFKLKYKGSKSDIRTRSDNRVLYMDACDVDEAGLSEGLKYSYYELVDNYGKQPEIDLLKADGDGVTDSITNKLGNRSGNYALRFEGYIYVPDDDYYTFSLKSDDGSVLKIDNRTIVDNSGVHTVKTREGSIGLCKGYHKIIVEYFENGDGNGILELTWTGGKYIFKH